MIATHRQRAARAAFLALTAAALLGLTIAADEWWLQPRLELAVRENETRARLTGELAAEKLRRLSLEQQQARLGSEGKKLADFRDKGLPGAATAQTDLQRAVHRAITASRLSAPSIRYGSSEGKERSQALKRLTAEFAVTGDYAAVKRLLAELESAPEFVVIDDFGLDVTAPRPGEASAAVGCRVRASVFYRPTPGVRDER